MINVIFSPFTESRKDKSSVSSPRCEIAEIGYYLPVKRSSSSSRFTSEETIFLVFLEDRNDTAGEDVEEFEKETRFARSFSIERDVHERGREGEGLHEQLTVYIGFLLGIGGKRRSREAKTKRSRRRRRGGGGRRRRRRKGRGGRAGRWIGR